MKGRIIRDEKTSKLPVVGKIRIGEKAISEKTGKEYPRALDYFKATGKYAGLFDKAFGEKPTVIQVLFVSDDMNFCCNERYELRTSKGDLYAKGDGEEFLVYDEKEKKYKSFFKADYPDIMDKAEVKTATQWQRVLTLRFLVPKINGVFGLWQVETKADKSSIDAIKDVYDYVFERAGTVTRVLFDLNVSKHKSQKPNDPSTYPVLTLVPNISDDNLLILKEFIESGKQLSGTKYIDDDTILQLAEGEVKQLAEVNEVKEKPSEETDDNPLFKY